MIIVSCCVVCIVVDVSSEAVCVDQVKIYLPGFVQMFAAVLLLLLLLLL